MAGIFSSANAGGSIVLFLTGVLSPFAGARVDKFKPKRAILGGIFIVAVARALLSTIHIFGSVLCILLPARYRRFGRFHPACFDPHRPILLALARTGGRIH